MKTGGRLLTCWLLLHAATVFADVASEARAAGTAGSAAIITNLSTQPAQEMTPGYTANPPQTSLNMTTMNSSTATLLALCQSSPSDPNCEAILKAQSDETVQRSQPALTGDPSVQNALNATQGTVITNFSAGYSGCTTTTTTTGAQYYTPQSCYNYYLREPPDQPCVKTRQVSVSWSCSFGALGPYIDANGYHYCERPTCNPGDTLSQDASGAWICTPPPPAASGVVATSLVPATLVREAAIPTVNQWWNNGCAGFEARVPPGMLPPDGQNVPSSRVTQTGSPNKCMRSNSTCTDAWPTTRIFDTVPVTNSCWQYTNTFDCVDLSPQSDCNQPRWGQCTSLGAPVCVDHDPIDTSICTAERQDFSCMTADTRRPQTSTNCAGQVYTDDTGVQWNTGHAPNADLPSAVAIMEAGREAGTYMSSSAAGLQLFKGFDNRCEKKLFGLVNCCNKTGGIDLAGFSDFSIISSAASTAWQAAGSTYTFDALYAADAPSWLMQGMDALFQSGGYQSVLAGFLAGSVSVEQLLSAMAPGPWSLAILAIQYSGILSCPQDQQITSIKRGAGLCIDLGDYCSQEFHALFFSVCIARTQTACCFNSKLAKAINVQGKAQLGRSMGSATSPNCGGFTPDDFTRLNLSTMDFSEFMDSIQPQAVDAASTASRAIPMNCYYGVNGKCN